MNRFKDIISKLSRYSEYNNIDDHSFINSDMSTLKIYNKKIKIYVLNFFLRFSLFMVLILVLLRSSNLDSCKSWNYENDIENTSYIKNRRSLAESKNIEPETDGSKRYLTDEIKYINKQMITQEPLLLRMKQINYDEKKDDNMQETKEKIDIDQEETTDNIDKYRRRNYMEFIGMLKSNKKLAALYGITLLTLISFILIIVSIIQMNVNLYVEPVIDNTSILFLALSILLISIFLIHR